MAYTISGPGFISPYSGSQSMLSTGGGNPMPNVGDTVQIFPVDSMSIQYMQTQSMGNSGVVEDVAGTQVWVRWSHGHRYCYPYQYLRVILPDVDETKDSAQKASTVAQKVMLDSVVMTDAKRDEIRSAISQMENQKQIFEEWGFADVFEKGTAVTMLFYGVPGTGKTLTAQAIADDLGAELKIYGTAEIESSEPGGAERMMQEIFAEAANIFKSGKKRVLLFDECDSLLVDRNEVGPIIGAQINCLLQLVERHEGVIIFTTNRLGKLDPALERRITAKIEFEFPTRSQREAIWQRMIPVKAPIGKDVNLKRLSDYPLAGGNIKNAVLNAARAAAYQKADAISMKHFKDAIEREERSVHAFAAAYDDQPHSRPSSRSEIARHSTGLSVQRSVTTKKDMVMEKVEGLQKKRGGKNG